MSTLTYTPPDSLYEFFTSDKFINLVIGPVGSTKTTAGILKIAHEAKRIKAGSDGIRRSRCVWIRQTREQLRDTSIPDFLRWYPAGLAGSYSKTEYKFQMKFADVECEVLFRGLDDSDDVRRLLSLQATFAVADEFRELNPQVFEAMQGRLGRYPSKADNGVGACDDNGKQIDKFWGMSNPPDMDTFWEQYLSNPPANAAVFFQPSGLSPEADWTQYLKDDYYENLAEGKSQDWIDVFIHAKFGKSLSGQPVFRAFDRETHVSKNPLTHFKGSQYPILIGMDFGLCYDDQTEVLTDAGWRFFKDVDEHRDLVATLNPDGYSLEYAAINFKVDRHYEGELIEFSTQNMNFCVTPEHRTPNTCRGSADMLRFDSAEDLARGTQHRFIQLAAQPASGRPMRMFGVPDDLMASFLGWYVSEGSTYVTGNSYRVTISQNKPATALHDVMTDSRWPWAWTRVSGTTGWRATVPKEFGEFVFELGKASDKHVPHQLLWADGTLARLFLSAYVAGDGHVRSRTRVGSGAGRKQTGETTAATVSTRLKDELQILALRAGYASSVRWQKGQTSTMTCGRKIVSSGVWVVTIKQFSRAEITPSAAKRVPYSGRIYCLNVPYHTLYVRRKGKPCWNGNTPATVLAQIDPQGRLLVFDSLTSEGMGTLRFCREKLKPRLAQRFPAANVLIIGDPAGQQRGQSDERSVFDILRQEGFRVVPAKTNTIVGRLNAVDAWLTRMVDGKPAILIDPCARELIDALRGGYRYKIRTSGETDDKPEKNKHSHVADACFAAGTLVETNYGAVPIEQVQPGMLVLTPAGYCHVSAAGMTLADAEVTEYTLSDGRRIIATPSHPVYAHGYGWVAIDSLQYSDILECVSTYTGRAWNKNTQSKSLRGFGTTARQKATTRLITWLLGSHGTCTGMSGSTTMALSPGGLWCTTKTMTEQTTGSRTLQSCLPATMQNCTFVNGLMDGGRLDSARPASLLPFGMEPQRVLSSTGSLGNSLGSGELQSACDATGAEMSSLAMLQPQREVFVARLARGWREKQAASITWSGRVVSAAHALWSTSTQRKQPALRIVGARPLPQRAVYNLTVEGSPVFFANGVLVHNCQYLALHANQGVLGDAWQTRAVEVQKRKWVWA